MSKKLIFSLAVFFITVGVLVFVKFIYLNSSNRQLVPNKTSTPIKEASLSLLPNPLVTSASRSASLNVILNSNLLPAEPKLVQIELSYDPEILLYVSVLPGDYFLSPEVVLNKVDTNTGRISYALKGTSTNVNAATVAVINFSSINYDLQKETKFSFLPKTLIRNDDGKIKLSSVTGARVIVEPSFFYFVPQASISGEFKQ